MSIVGNKKGIKIAGFIVVLLFGLFFLYYTTSIAYKNGTKYALFDFNQDQVQTVKLEHNMTYDVPFVSEYDTIQGFSMIFEYDVRPSIIITYELMDAQTGAVLASGNTSESVLASNDYSNFAFQHAVDGLKGRELNIHIRFEGMMEHEISIEGVKAEQGDMIPITSVTTAGKSGFYYAYFVILSLLVVMLVGVYVVSAGIGLHARVPVEALFLGALILVAMAYLIMIPTGAAPDEAVHIHNAYKLSNVFAGHLQEKAGQISVRKEDIQWIFDFKDVRQNTLENYYNHLFQSLRDSSLDYMDSRTTRDPIWLYTFSGIGLTVGRVLGLGTLMTFLIARLFNAAFFVASCYFAMKLLPFGKMIVFVWAFLPITLQQGCSFSYDCVVNGLSILIVSLTLHLLFTDEIRNRKLKVVLLIFMALVLLPCKQYAVAPISFLPILLIFEHHPLKDADKKTKRIVACVLGVLILVAIPIIVRMVYIWTRPENINNTPVIYEGKFGGNEGNSYTIGYFILHPKDIITILLNTLWDSGDQNFGQMLGTSLGWLNIPIPWIFCIASFVFLLLSSIRREGENVEISLGQKSWIWLVAFLVIGFTYAGMLLHWTPCTVKWIRGVQGRYFLPVLLPLLLTIRSKGLTISRKIDRVLPVLVSVNAVFIVTSFFLQVVR